MAARRPGSRRPALCVWRLMALLLPVAWSCASSGSESGGTAKASQSVGPVVHNAFGMPGPWWRDDGSPQVFETDLATCRRESSEARERRDEPDPLDAAYRAFLGCMDGNGWQRGLPPALSSSAPPGE